MLAAVHVKQEALKRILFIFAKLNPGIRYVQGMNEVLAPLYYVFKTDVDEANVVSERYLSGLIIHEFLWLDICHIPLVYSNSHQRPQSNMMFVVLRNMQKKIRFSVLWSC